jgi:perosamine synthetase
MTKLDAFIARRRELVRAYDKAFEGWRWCRPAQRTGRGESAHHIYVLRVDFAGLGRTRADVMSALRARGIITQVHYIPVPSHPFFRAMGHVPERYPNALAYYEEALTIPLFVGLTSGQQQDVVEALRAELA